MSADLLGELTACPECSATAEVTDRVLLDSTDGPVEHARIRCVRRHWFYMPTAGLESGVARDPVIR
jgi:hypothetical protein